MTPEQLYARASDASRTSGAMHLQIVRTGQIGKGHATQTVLPACRGAARVDGDRIVDQGPWTLVTVRPHHILVWMATSGFSMIPSDLMALQEAMIGNTDITVDTTTSEWKEYLDGKS